MLDPRLLTGPDWDSKLEDWPGLVRLPDRKHVLEIKESLATNPLPSHLPVLVAIDTSVLEDQNDGLFFNKSYHFIE